MPKIKKYLHAQNALQYNQINQSYPRNPLAIRKLRKLPENTGFFCVPTCQLFRILKCFKTLDVLSMGRCNVPHWQWTCQRRAVVLSDLGPPNDEDDADGAVVPGDTRSQWSTLQSSKTTYNWLENQYHLKNFEDANVPCILKLEKSGFQPPSMLIFYWRFK